MMALECAVRSTGSVHVIQVQRRVLRRSVEGAVKFLAANSNFQWIPQEFKFLWTSKKQQSGRRCSKKTTSRGWPALYTYNMQLPVYLCATSVFCISFARSTFKWHFIRVAVTISAYRYSMWCGREGYVRNEIRFVVRCERQVLVCFAGFVLVCQSLRHYIMPKIIATRYVLWVSSRIFCVHRGYRVRVLKCMK